jgi:hypothetical protein
MHAAALINYPGHFLSTLGTIKNFLEITEWRPPWYIFVDDLGPQWEAWPDYLNELRSVIDLNFPALNPTYILFSEFKFPYVWDGWLRQQMVKLNLDRFLPGDLWYVTDGDVICERLIGANEIPYNYQTTHNPLINAQQYTYIKHMLGIEQKLQLNGEVIYTHHVPVRWVTRDDLHGLYRHVSKTVSNDANIAHFNLMREERIIGYGPTAKHMSMTEWDLLETWRILVDDQISNFHYWIIDDGATPRQNVPVTRIKTFFGTDRDFSLEYFKKQDLQVPVDAWNRVLTISRT